MFFFISAPPEFWGRKVYNDFHKWAYSRRDFSRGTTRAIVLLTASERPPGGCSPSCAWQPDNSRGLALDNISSSSSMQVSIFAPGMYSCREWAIMFCHQSYPSPFEEIVKKKKRGRREGRHSCLFNFLPPDFSSARLVRTHLEGRSSIRRHLSGFIEKFSAQSPNEQSGSPATVAAPPNFIYFSWCHKKRRA